MIRFPGFILAAALAFASATQARVLVPDIIDTLAPSGYDHAAQFILKDEKGRLLVAGGLANGYSAVADVGVALLDSNRKVLAQKRYGHRGMDNLLGVVADGHGGYYLFGQASGFDSKICPHTWSVYTGFDPLSQDICDPDAGNDYYRLFAIKLDVNLDTVWTRVMDTSGTSVAGFTDAAGGLRLVYGSRPKDSTCLVTLGPQGNRVSTNCVQAGISNYVMGAPLSGDRLMVGGSVYDYIAIHAEMWMTLCDAAGKPTWHYLSPHLSMVDPFFMYPFGDGVLSYWRIQPDPAGSFGQYEEVRVQGTTVTRTILPSLSKMNPATQFYRTPEGAVVFPPSKDLIVSAKPLNLETDAAGIIDTAAGVDLQYSSVYFPDSTHLWFTFGYLTTKEDMFRYGRARIDQAPRFPDALKNKIWKSLEDDTATATLSALDDHPEGLHIKILGARDTALFEPGTGLFRWLPKPNWHGDTTFRFVATDTVGQTDTLTAHFSIANVNDPIGFIHSDFQPSTITGTGGTSLVPIRIPAFDLDAEPLAYKLLAQPPGLTLGDNGSIVWNPKPVPPGFYPLAVRVSDSASYADAAYSLWVTDGLPPIMDTLVGRNPAFLGGFLFGTKIMVRSLSPKDTAYAVYLLLRSDNAYPPSYHLTLESTGPADTTVDFEIEFYCGFAVEKTEALINGKPLAKQFLPTGPGIRFSARVGQTVDIRTHYGETGEAIRVGVPALVKPVSKARYDALGRAGARKRAARKAVWSRPEQRNVY
ncbi:MAG: hypothetical protein JWO30_4688 [Fibrobacteres bacterium]|nr:hypothetical protein [Fibrobacterota bacterium]